MKKYKRGVETDCHWAGKKLTDVCMGRGGGGTIIMNLSFWTNVILIRR